MLEEGISSKMSTGVRFLSQGIVGFIMAFYYSWDMGLVLLGVSPIVVFSVWFMTKTTVEVYTAAPVSLTLTLTSIYLE